MSQAGRTVSEMGPEIVLVSPVESESLALRQIFVDSQTSVHWFPTCQAALAFLWEHSLGVVISSARLADGCWKDLLNALSQIPHSPNLIVSSRLADNKLWAEVLNLGGYDLLLSPFEPEEVQRVSSAAWRAWQHRPGETSLPRDVAGSAADSRLARKPVQAAMRSPNEKGAKRSTKGIPN
jgi:DNA-binding NtrC family response regulator